MNKKFLVNTYYGKIFDCEIKITLNARKVRHYFFNRFRCTLEKETVFLHKVELFENGVLRYKADNLMTYKEVEEVAIKFEINVRHSLGGHYSPKDISVEELERKLLNNGFKK